MELENQNPDQDEVEIRIVTASVQADAPVLEPSIESRRMLQREPDATPVMFQTWANLLFLHWEWDPTEIQKTLPPGLYVDTFGAKAYLGLTPFFMNEVRASFLPEIPGASNFLELNVRTYVHDRHGIPGIWFYSLDCNQSLAVWMAKLFYSLPYHSATMEAGEQGGTFVYRCQRFGRSETSEFHYRREDKPVAAAPGSLPFFLSERYLLYSHAARSGKLYRARVYHAPWQLFHARLGKFDDSMLQINGFDARLRPPEHRWLAEPARVKIYALEEME
jgi:uncharacterized protein YqjF (DUF2071 family)